jgi:glucose-6-phosphate-specific signal transduction histidine kinase
LTHFTIGVKMQHEERILGFVMMTVVGLTMIVILTISRKNKRRAKQAEYDLEVASTKIEILEHQLKSAGWELSDNIGQLISTIRMRLMVMVPDIPDVVRANFMEIIHLTGDSLKEIRNLHALMHHDLMSGGLVKLLREELERSGRMKPVQRSFITTGVEISLEKEIHILFIGIVREFFSQLDKYANNSDILMQVDFLGESVIRVRIKTAAIDKDTFKKFKMERLKRKAGALRAALTIHLSESDEVDLLLSYSIEFNKKKIITAR